MIEIRYKRVLLVQTFFLIALSFFSYILARNSATPAKFLLLWILAIILNISFLKKYALPTRSLLKKIKSNTTKVDLPWIEIEDTIAKKDKALSTQKEKYELENLKYKLLLDSLQDPVCIYNKDLLVIYANSAFCSHFNFPEDQLPTPLIEISRNLDFQKFLTDAISTPTSSRLNYFSFNQLQDPHKYYFDLKVFPVANIQSYLCLLHDVTERKMADLMREDFVSNFSHEVRTPLTILNGQMQNLKLTLINDPDYESKFSTYFEKIENNSRRLITLFNDLLRLSSVESKKEILKESIDIEEMLTFLTQDLLINYNDKKISIDILLGQKSFWVDYNLFEQILINLIDNAYKYIGQSGEVKIRSSHQDGWDHLIITDTGLGIPEEQIHRIFERFFRIDSSRSSQVDGTGLGLSIVKHIIQKHEGRIKVQSKTGEGTTFTLSFPSEKHS